MSEAATNPRLDFDQADRLRKALRFADVSVQEMADHLGLSRNSVGRYINGHIEPDLRTLRLWAMKTGAPLDWLQYGDEGPTSTSSSDIRTGIHEEWAEQPSTADIQSMMKSIGDLVPLVRPADAARVRGVVR